MLWSLAKIFWNIDVYVLKLGGVFKYDEKQLHTDFKHFALGFPYYGQVSVVQVMCPHIPAVPKVSWQTDFAFLSLELCKLWSLQKPVILNLNQKTKTKKAKKTVISTDMKNPVPCCTANFSWVRPPKKRFLITLTSRSEIKN